MVKNEEERRRDASEEGRARTWKLSTLLAGVELSTDTLNEVPSFGNSNRKMCGARVSVKAVCVLYWL
jgi:2-oxoglutarate dehydrogenase complex dehydrogenase (E1) component-like enzyme